MLAMRQTFQQWMVLLSALILLLLPALLCYAMPMETGASSSSGPHHPAMDAGRNVPEGPPVPKGIHYYFKTYQDYGKDSRVMTNDELDRHFGTHIRYDGWPVFFTNDLEEANMNNALRNYGKIWLLEKNNHRENLLVHESKRQKKYITVHAFDKDLHNRVSQAQDFELEHGTKAMVLRYGPPFEERPKRRFFDYKVPEWKHIERSSTPTYDLEKTGINFLRNTLDHYNYLKVHNSANGKLLGFALEQDGGVLSKVLGRYHG
ncbi:hypothetical protein NDA18_006054 [Ustilago nuda]|nr:hypothetical protein NDA18_006054 [Ustilago nuda]